MTQPPDDPDTIWKPGYTGGYRVPSTSPTSTERGHTTGRVVAGVLIVMVLGAGGLAMLTNRNGKPVTPPVVEWTATFDSYTVSALTSDPDVVVVLLDRPGTLVALDHRTGAERWRWPVPGAAATGLDIVDGVAIVRHVEPDAAGRAVAIDTATGGPLWSLALSAGEHVDVVDGLIWRDRVRSTTEGPAGSAMIDPRTGRPTGGTGPLVGFTANEHLITRWGTATGVRRAWFETDRGSIEVTVDDGARVAALSFVPVPS